MGTWYATINFGGVTTYAIGDITIDYGLDLATGNSVDPSRLTWAMTHLANGDYSLAVSDNVDNVPSLLRVRAHVSDDATKWGYADFVPSLSASAMVSSLNNRLEVVQRAAGAALLRCDGWKSNGGVSMAHSATFTATTGWLCVQGLLVNGEAKMLGYITPSETGPNEWYEDDGFDTDYGSVVPDGTVLVFCWGGSPGEDDIPAGTVTVTLTDPVHGPTAYSFDLPRIGNTSDTDIPHAVMTPAALPNYNKIPIRMTDMRADRITSGLGSLDAAALRAALGMAAADLDDQLDALPTAAEVAAAVAAPSAASIATAVLAAAVEGSLTLAEATRIMLAVLAGKSSGGGTTAVAFRDQADSKPRVSATVDANGNRTAISVDGA